MVAENNKKIVLISVYDPASLGLRSIYFQLLKEGFDAHMVFFGKFEGIENKLPTEKDYSILIDLLKEINPSIVGLSSLTFSFNIAIDLVKKIKDAINPLILMGGTHALIEPEECLQYADVVCVWEGDISLPEFCLRFFDNGDYTNIPNLWVKKGDEIIKNPLKLVIDMDSLALPDFESKNVHYIDNDEIKSGKWLLSKNNSYNIRTGRGCPNRCSYCINNIFGEKFGKAYLRKRSVGNVIKELKLAKAYFNNIELVAVMDDIFTMDIDWLREFCKIYKKEINLPFWCHLYPHFASEEAINLLKEAGAIMLAMGIQSGSKQVREQVYERYTSDEAITNAVLAIKKSGVKGLYDLIINNPFETDDDLRQSVKFLLSLPRPIGFRMYSLTNYPKTRLTERLLREGLIDEPDSYDASRGFRVSKKQPFKAAKDEYWYYIFNFIPKRFIPKSLIIFLTRDIFIKNPGALLPLFELGNRIYQLKERLTQKIKNKEI